MAEYLGFVKVLHLRDLAGDVVYIDTLA